MPPNTQWDGLNMDADKPIIEGCSHIVAEVLAKVKKAGEQSLQVSQRSLAAKVV